MRSAIFFVPAKAYFCIKEESMTIESTLKSTFGFSEFKTGQKEVVNNILKGESAAAIFPTGSGKSLCYQFSAMQLPHLTLVVSPLLALISDQLDFLQSKNIPAARIDSTLQYKELIDIQNQVRNGEIKILFISVERFKNERFRNFLSQVKTSMLVVDEAHCISEWGHNFRPDYLKLPIYRKDFNIEQVLLLTATATPRVIEDMEREFQIPKQNICVTGFHRSNLHLKVMACAETEKNAQLLRNLSSTPEEATIVYVTLQKTAEDVASYLKQNGLNSSAYHAGMANDYRESIQNRFMSGETPIIVATIAFGMGIDKANIRRVVHYDMPKSLENYSQEIGRAGRDNEKSECLVLGNLDGIHTLENFVYGDTPEANNIEVVLKQIKNAESSWETQLLSLSKDSNMRALPLKTLLVYLETMGIILPSYSYFSSYRFKNIKETESIIQKFKGEHHAFVSAIFEHSKKARLWTAVDFDAIATNYNCDRKRISTALDYFHEKNWIQLETKQMTEVFKVLKPEFDITSTSKELISKFRMKEEAEIKRIGMMCDFFNSQDCLSKQLAAYFGESTDWDKCGTCSSCLDGGIKLSQTQSLPELQSLNLSEYLNELSAKSTQPLSPILLCKFLCGISSPKLSSLKANKLGGFGLTEKYRFQDVLKAIENHN
ncbi:RecQ family ATP-dependent DNA helicase [Carboxylicivirga sp. N1Y90]|uniref:RecQ family ATP-dependent DNA helicase n=1 Tax=Carboxylicivirga fragile TaxID=3417571 RepID=UPI003D33D54B|nr:RecQ family ATP-dependent DNA helicase [Marinilabiliaceae bacterium N1Y90]